MGKVLLIGKKNPIFKDIYAYLEKAEDFHLQICPEQYEVVQYIVDIMEPDVVVISLIGLDDTNDELFSYFKYQKPYMKALCLGNDFEQENFKNWLTTSYYEVISRPFNNNVILERIKELIQISEKEKAEREEESQRKMMTGIEEQSEEMMADEDIYGEIYGEFEVEEEYDTLEESLETKLQNLKSARGANERRKIMLIDDNPVQLRALRGNLIKDYDILLATSGGEALKIMEKNVPDMVFLDYEMPGLDGKAVLKIMREHSVLRNVPVIFLTGEKDRGRIMEVFKLNPDGYMLKPVNYENLRGKIFETLGE